MYLGRDFDPTQVGEAEFYGFDFTPEIDTADTISSVAWTCTVAAISPASDPSPSARIVGGSSTIDGKKVYVKLSGFVAGVIYSLQAIITTAAGETVALWANVKCEP